MIMMVNDLMDKFIDGWFVFFVEVEKEKEEEDVDVILVWFCMVRDVLYIYGYWDCEGCIGLNGWMWDFENDFYVCWYCYDLFFCGFCFDVFKKVDLNKL